MNVLLDTHVLLWAAGQPDKLSESTRSLLTASQNTLYFSAASLWEIVIKNGLGREDFKVDAARLRKMLILHGYKELPITPDHVLSVQNLPLHHKDPFDRILLAQARTEGLRFATVDENLCKYKDPVLFIG